MNTLDKENLFRCFTRTAMEQMDLEPEKLIKMVDILTKVFEDVEFVAKKNEVSDEVVTNNVFIKNYLGCCYIKGLKESTIQNYEVTLRCFTRFIKMDLRKVDTNTIRRYLLYYEKTVSKTTADNTRRNLNGFFSFMEDEGYIQKNPCKRINRIKDEKKIRRFYDDLEMETMRDSCISRKEIALIDLLLSTGLRVSECAGIKLKEIDWEKRTIVIHGKGGKDRIVPFSVRAKKHLQEYLLERGICISEFLFCSERKPHGGLASITIQKIVKDVGIRAGLPDITVHCFRRWFATNMYNKGMEPRYIQTILGHAKFETTVGSYLKDCTEKAIQSHEYLAV